MIVILNWIWIWNGILRRSLFEIDDSNFRISKSLVTIIYVISMDYDDIIANLFN